MKGRWLFKPLGRRVSVFLDCFHTLLFGQPAGTEVTLTEVPVGRPAAEAAAVSQCGPDGTSLASLGSRPAPGAPFPGHGHPVAAGGVKTGDVSVRGRSWAG